MADMLTPQQQEAVDNRGGNLLVSAAAGSGKTKVLVDRLMSYILDPVNPANIDDFIANYTHYYQLYRNAIRITDKNKHLILLYPKNNTTVNKEATTFIEDKIREEYRGNIHILHWEDIVKEGELYEKYFAE